ncbi:VanZ family protein [Endozoicomonas sp. OPT23]|uniref:VanZ family protein n=1 Tax=Endozoicomonas sp. OPT23 TaxID=2072845 RepID=UPI00129AEDE5|nr:VanZ family protein [Endozoicomonas sp. OPT23]
METLIKRRILKHYFNLSRFGLGLALITITILALLPIDQAPLPKISDKIQHLTAFFTLAFLLDCSFPKSSFQFPKILTLAGYGLLIEMLQWFSGYRFFSLLDVVADLSGVVIYIALIPILRKIPLVKWRWELAENSN